MLVKNPKAEEAAAMPVVERDQKRARAGDGRMMDYTFAPVAIVCDAGRWYFYERGDEIPPEHRTAGEKEAAKS